MTLLLLFWVSLILLLHSYVAYPQILSIFAKWKISKYNIYELSDDLPTISVIISAYNEEKHIESKIRNILSSSYPNTKIEILVGSDGSNDNTSTILTKLATEFTNLKIYLYEQRLGKASVLNTLVPCAQGKILVLTDVKVSFTNDTLYQLVKHFKNKEMGCVGANIVNKNNMTPEKTYMSQEMRIKYLEGKIWGNTIGLFGACYAIPRQFFTPIPEGFSVEDFYISMEILRQKKRCILELDAICFENVTDKLSEEFRRKIRISVGNFQNLVAFKQLIFKLSPVSFCYFSHKIIRWFGPILILILFLTGFLLVNDHPFYFYFTIFQIFTLIITLIDLFLHIFRSDILILRFVSHFYAMNLALLIGFIKFLKGVKTNVWEPTKR